MDYAPKPHGKWAHTSFLSVRIHILILRESGTSVELNSWSYCMTLLPGLKLNRWGNNRTTLAIRFLLSVRYALCCLQASGERMQELAPHWSLSLMTRKHRLWKPYRSVAISLGVASSFWVSSTRAVWNRSTLDPSTGYGFHCSNHYQPMRRRYNV